MATIWFNNSIGFGLQFYLSITSVVETSVSRENQKTTSTISPSNAFLTNNSLHDGIKTTFGGIQVTGHGGLPYLALER